MAKDWSALVDVVGSQERKDEFAVNFTMQVKRWFTLAAIYFFTVYIPLGWLFMVISFADEIDAEIEHGLSWLFPGDWVKVRFAMVWLGVVLCIGMAIISTLGRT